MTSLPEGSAKADPPRHNEKTAATRNTFNERKYISYLLVKGERYSIVRIPRLLSQQRQSIFKYYQKSRLHAKATKNPALALPKTRFF
jgi:hypothetical protein